MALRKRHQVLCITHRAQIAAMADAHYLIEKQINDNKTTTGDPASREDEHPGTFQDFRWRQRSLRRFKYGKRDEKLAEKHEK